MQKIPGLVCSGEELHHLQHPQREEELTDPASKAKSDTPSGSHQLCTSFTDVLQQAWEKKTLRQEENFLEDERPLGN